MKLSYLGREIKVLVAPFMYKSDFLYEITLSEFQLKPLTASVTANPQQEQGSHCGTNFWCHGRCEIKYQKLILYLFTNRKLDVLAMNKTVRDFHAYSNDSSQILVLNDIGVFLHNRKMLSLSLISVEAQSRQKNTFLQEQKFLFKKQSNKQTKQQDHFNIVYAVYGHLKVYNNK